MEREKERERMRERERERERDSNSNSLSLSSSTLFANCYLPLSNMLTSPKGRISAFYSKWIPRLVHGQTRPRLAIHENSSLTTVRITSRFKPKPSICHRPPTPCRLLFSDCSELGYYPSKACTTHRKSPEFLGDNLAI